MNGSRAFLVVAIDLLTTLCSADPIVLASFDRRRVGAGAPETDPRVEILLTHSRLPPVRDEVRIGEDLWWEDGESGVVDFYVSSGGNVAMLADRITDGLDEALFNLVFGTGGGSGGGGFESAWLGHAPDLVGNQIDFIRMIVHDVSIVPYTDPFDPDPLDGIMWDVNLTYEFWGHPVPEPGTALLMAFGGTAAFFAHRRRASEHSHH